MMQPEPTLQHRVQLRNLESFLQSLSGALVQTGHAPDTLRELFTQTLVAECNQCEMRIGGEELYLLGHAAEAGKQNSRLIRLRRGYCAREGCGSDFCVLTFLPRVGVDWKKLLDEAEQPSGVQTEAPNAHPAEREARRKVNQRLAARAALLVIVVIALFVFRQWYRGGRIPLIREPEQFKVDVQAEPAPGKE